MPTAPMKHIWENWIAHCDRCGPVVPYDRCRRWLRNLRVRWHRLFGHGANDHKHRTRWATRLYEEHWGHRHEFTWGHRWHNVSHNQP